MCRTACTEPQCLYKGALYFYVFFVQSFYQTEELAACQVVLINGTFCTESTTRHWITLVTSSSQLTVNTVNISNTNSCLQISQDTHRHSMSAKCRVLFVKVIRIILNMNYMQKNKERKKETNKQQIRPLSISSIKRYTARCVPLTLWP